MSNKTENTEVEVVIEAPKKRGRKPTFESETKLFAAQLPIETHDMLATLAGKGRLNQALDTIVRQAFQAEETRLEREAARAAKKAGKS